ARAVPGLRAALRAVDPTMPLAEVATVSELMRESGARRRFGAVLVAGFAALALSLSLVGVYGVAAQFVAQRRRELAIRLALGAADASVVRLVLCEGLVTALTGATAGLGAAFALGRDHARRDLPGEYGRPGHLSRERRSAAGFGRPGHLHPGPPRLEASTRGGARRGMN